MGSAEERCKSANDGVNSSRKNRRRASPGNFHGGKRRLRHGGRVPGSVVETSVASSRAVKWRVETGEGDERGSRGATRAGVCETRDETRRRRDAASISVVICVAVGGCGRWFCATCRLFCPNRGRRRWYKIGCSERGEVGPVLQRMSTSAWENGKTGA